VWVHWPVQVDFALGAVGPCHLDRERDVADVLDVQVLELAAPLPVGTRWVPGLPIRCRSHVLHIRLSAVTPRSRNRTGQRTPSRGNLVTPGSGSAAGQPVIRKPSRRPSGGGEGEPSRRLVTYVPDSPSFETPDEGATDGPLTGIESVRSQAQSSAAGLSLSLAMGVTTILLAI